MCFGPTASFSSGVLLSAIGVATLSQVRAKRELLYAGFPIVFALHQFNEGFLWLSLEQGMFGDSQHWLTLAFLIVALVLWPIYSPLSVFLIEDRPTRRKIMIPFLIVGTCLSIYLFANLLSGVYSASIINCGLYYDFLLPHSEVYVAILYIFVSFGPAVFSSRRAVVAIGIINVVFCALAAAIYYKNFISVWCFFASQLSVMIYLFFRNQRMRER